MPSSVEARQTALQLLEGTATVQSYHLAYMDAFMLIAVLFLCCLPLLLFIKMEKGKGTDLSSSH